MFTVLPYRTQVTLKLIMNTLSSPQNGCFVGSDAYTIENHPNSKYLGSLLPKKEEQQLQEQFLCVQGPYELSSTE